MGKKCSKQKKKERLSSNSCSPAVHEVSKDVECDLETPSDDDDGNISPRDILPLEIWWHIFSFLSMENLLNVEQAGEQWKELVSQHLRSSDRLDKQCSTLNKLQPVIVLKILQQFGWSLRQLTLNNTEKYHEHGNLLIVIGDGCPNLVKLVLTGGKTVCDTGLKHLALKCDKLQDISFVGSNDCTDKGLEFLLKSLQQLKRLRLRCDNGLKGKCFDHLGPKLEELTLDIILDTPSPTLLKLVSKLPDWTLACQVKFERFGEIRDSCKEFSLNRIVETNGELVQISHLNGLAIRVNGMYDDVDIWSSSFLNSFNRIWHLGNPFADMSATNSIHSCHPLVELDFSGSSDRVSDVTLEYLKTSDLLKHVAVRSCKLITERGCIDLVTRCTLLEVLDIRGCSQITDSILEPCSMAVQNRRDESHLKLMVAGTSINNSHMGNSKYPRLDVDFEAIRLAMCYYAPACQ